MSRSYLISAEQALKETQGDYDQQIDRLNNLIKEAAVIGLRSILAPSDMVSFKNENCLFSSFSQPDVEKEVKNKGFTLKFGNGWIEVQW